MEAKPIITCHGNQSLFSSLHPAVVQGLPKEVCEWRRSFGRAPRSVQLEGSFVPYDADILPEEDTKTLVSRPYFHIFWTDCDLDGYKQTVRDELAEWQAALKARNIPDWLIVVVIPDESKVKAKLLPRSSVIDKVRNDFCSKQPDRSVVLTEPLRLESKSVESWNQLFSRLRGLLLQAYNRHLNKYEENMRTLREKRNEHGWTYFDYFAVQEELGFMLEVLGLKEDALIQYDELDAMFDQFVENHASGDPVTWLTPLVQPCTSWIGLSLAKPIDLDLRDRVKRTTVSLLEFRNYLFCRQAALLFSMGRAWEVAERAFDFLRNTVIEMTALEVSLPVGALQCWVVLSGLEVLAACQKYESGQVDKCSIYTAHLWDHIRGKLKWIGQMCCLMPGMVPTSEQLNHILDLKGGMALSHDQETVGDVRPVDKLHEALSSPESFKKHYLEMCELAMGTYKHISRFRSARKIGRELANFYMKIGEPQKAESFIQDAVKMYRQEGWPSLAHATLRELAACYRQMGHANRFLMTACEIACSEDLPSSDRIQYFKEITKALDGGESVQVVGRRLVRVRQVQLSRTTVRMEEEVKVTLQLHSLFPGKLTCDFVQVDLAPVVEDQLNETSRAEGQTPSADSQEPQVATFDIHTTPPSQILRRSFPDMLAAHAMLEQRQGRVLMSGITCDNAHDLLKRTDSAPAGMEMADTLCKGEYSCCASATGVTLSAGHSEVALTMKAQQEGVFAVRQVCVQVQGLEMVVPVPPCYLRLQVASYRPSFTLTPTHTEEFMAGVEQAGVLRLRLGSQSVEEATTASLTSPHLTVSTPHPHQGHHNGQLTLASQGPHTSVDMDVVLHMDMDTVTAADRAGRFTAQVECAIDGCPEVIQGTATFVTPLKVSHKVYTSRQRKFVSVSLVGATSAQLTVTRPQVTAPSASFTLLNPGGSWTVHSLQSLSLVWEIIVDPEQEEREISVDFTCCFACDLDLGNQPRTLSYQFSLGEIQTWYVVDCRLVGEGEGPGAEPSDQGQGRGEYKSGATYTLQVSVTPVRPPRPGALAFKAHFDPALWSFAGNTAGIFQVAESPFQTSLQVSPQTAGYLHLPSVHLYHARDSESHLAQTADGESATSASQGQDHEVPGLDPGTVLAEFSQGRVYNASLAKQVHVIAAAGRCNVDVEVTV